VTPLRLRRRNEVSPSLSDQSKHSYHSDSGYTKKSAAKLRAKIAKEWFKKLDDSEQADWAELAKQEHEEAMAQFKHATTAPPSTDPVDRQK